MTTLRNKKSKTFTPSLVCVKIPKDVIGIPITEYNGVRTKFGTLIRINLS